MAKERSSAKTDDMRRLREEATKAREALPKGVCSGCAREVTLQTDGLVAYHDWPPACRQVCKGSKKKPVK